MTSLYKPITLILGFYYMSNCLTFEIFNMTLRIDGDIDGNMRHRFTKIILAQGIMLIIIMLYIIMLIIWNSGYYDKIVHKSSVFICHGLALYWVHYHVHGRSRLSIEPHAFSLRDREVETGEEIIKVDQFQISSADTLWRPSPCHHASQPTGGPATHP